MVVITKEVRFIAYALSLYAAFIFWGYLQERITSTPYVLESTGETMEWNYPFALNFCMALATYFTASAIELLSGNVKPVPIIAFWKPALTACAASPIGYTALKYISYPLMVLTKSSKPVPVMIVGTIFYKRTYHWYKYVSVALVCGGIFMFTAAKKLNLHVADSIVTGSAENITSTADESAFHLATEDNIDGDGKGDTYVMLFGMTLVIINLALDGYTNNEQDRIFTKYKATAMDMMKYTNFWQAIYQALYLSVGLYLYGQQSELVEAKYMITNCTTLKMDIMYFCVAASIGQVLIFALMKEFGSLMWVTISVTRKLFTIIISVIQFKHHVNHAQWTGVGLVFLGLGLEVVNNYLSKSSSKEQKPVKSEATETVPVTDHSLRSSDLKRRVRSAHTPSRPTA